ncbi:nicotinate-nucleotide pyrophosphorylase (carboxylating) [Oscillibacter sp. PC13]|uniref:quinolinate phosphoribosyl transferase n=1 Tax=Oscillibacter sp. PC13 TaxID=1855299 RepID=UPI0008DF86F1|nr:quinolinate phosphoribosyl transferase [Oscillibacter sp. PC13]SFQ10808.1 nicotinate-nucleotide pyrophosphorylase (carboxylating) [Oscillibacter sp. PC13]
MVDVRDQIFAGIRDRKYRAVLTPERDGILSGAAEAAKTAETLGLEWKCACDEGGRLKEGVPFAELVACPKQIAMAEEQIIGTLAKASGIATAAKRAVDAAAGSVQIVSGSWKKMPPSLKSMVRQAISTGGASFRICQPPMLYIDKNFIRMFGSIPAALEAVAEQTEPTKIIQIKGMTCPVQEETRQALAGGANILMVDTGRLEDLEACQAELAQLGAREQIQVAFAGNVHIADIPDMARRGVDLLCIGKEIVDAGLLDMKLDVVEEMKA